MPHRVVKQFIYGIFYTAIFTGIGYGLYLFFLQPAPSCFDNRKNGGEQGVDCGGECIPCEVKRLVPLQVASIKLFHLPGDKTSTLIEMRNVNPGYGADHFTYTLTFFNGNGATTTSVVRESFIYASEIKTVAEPGLDIPALSAVMARVSVSNLSWRGASEFGKPSIQVREVKTVLDQKKRQAVISGVLVNENPYALRELFVTAVIATYQGGPIGVSGTRLESLAPQEERPFEVTVPDIQLSILTRDLVTVSATALR